MGFDIEGFRGAALAPRQAQVDVADIAHWFPDGEKPVWIVRGLAGEEFMRAMESSSRYDLVTSAVRALATAGHMQDDRVDALKSLIGFGAEVPAEMAKLLDCIVYGSVCPIVDRDLAVRLYATFPVVAWRIGMKVLELTGLGADPGKAPISTESPT